MDADGTRLGHPFVVGLEAHGDGRIIVSRKRLGDKWLRSQSSLCSPTFSALLTLPVLAGSALSALSRPLSRVYTWGISPMSITSLDSNNSYCGHQSHHCEKSRTQLHLTFHGLRSDRVLTKNYLEVRNKFTDKYNMTSQKWKRNTFFCSPKPPGPLVHLRIYGTNILVMTKDSLFWCNLTQNIQTVCSFDFVRTGLNSILRRRKFVYCARYFNTNVNSAGWV